jgi:hypothetical protein
MGSTNEISIGILCNMNSKLLWSYLIQKHVISLSSTSSESADFVSFGLGKQKLLVFPLSM